MSWESFCAGHYEGYGIGSHPGDEKEYPDNKKKFRVTLIEYWVSARTERIFEGGVEREEDKGKRNPNALEALEELYEEFGEDSMIIITFTNRNRRNLLEDIDDVQFKGGEYKWKIRGLRSVLLEWNNQVKNPKQKDSLEILIQNKPELYTKPSYMVTAMLHRVRRIRAGAKENEGSLVLADGILRESKKLLLYPGGISGKNHAVLENDQLELLIEMQKHLQDLRRKEPIENGDNLEDFTLKLEHLFSKRKVPTLPGLAVYYWWALRISFQRAYQNLEFIKAKNFRNKMDSAVSKMDESVQSYIKSVLAGEERNRPRDVEIVEYHRALAEFMHYCDKNVTTKDGKRSLKHKDGLLYKAALGDQSLTGFTRLFTWHATTKPSELIKRCRKSIIDAKRCISSISYGNKASAPSMLMLVLIDLLVRIRWYLSGSYIYNQKGNWGSNRAVDGKPELQIAIELKQEISHAVLRVQEQAFIGQEGTGQMHTLLGNWVEALNNFELIKEEQYKPSPRGGNKSRGPLGQLCDLCGKMVGWRWAPMRAEEEEDWDGDDTIRLHGFPSKDDSVSRVETEVWLEISTKGTENNPYVMRVGESASHE